MHSLIDQLANQIGAAAANRDAEKWSPDASPPIDYAGEIAHLKNWLTSRAAWIDLQFVPPPRVTSPTPTSRILHPNAGQTVYFTTDGTDPRRSGGDVARGVYSTTTPVRFDGAANVIARTKIDGTAAFPSTLWSSARQVQVAAAPGYAGWVAARLPEATIEDQAPTADPDGDSLPNFIEYALDQNPNSASPLPDPLLKPVIIEQGSQKFLDFTYLRRLDRLDVSLHVEVSKNLGAPPLSTWARLDDTLVSSQGIIETRKVRIPIAADSPQLFIRLSASEEP